RECPDAAPDLPEEIDYPENPEQPEEKEPEEELYNFEDYADNYED
ncbi:hypothetical protein NPIL_354581, partial [Nephila pilipes]